MYFQRMLSQYFDNSEASLLSFLVQEKKLSEGDIETLKDLINKSPKP
jgi:predicted transcriptional regulator